MVKIEVMKITALLSFFLCFSPFAYTQTQEKVGGAEGSAPNGRYLAIISDLHMGIGRHDVPDRSYWHPSEDFRWPEALQGFLDELSEKGNHAVDLVIAGDLFELWQPPENIKCIGFSEDLGCTVAEMVAIAKVVASEHAAELESFARFAQSGENRVHIIPGNHDSTLLLNDVWEVFSKPLKVESGRISRIKSGVWVSDDGRVVIEHGHQIGADVNKYDEWPDIVKEQDGKEYVVRPWGERFVQLMFNEQESQYPIIDNFNPEAAGVRYRMADQGVWGTAKDIARFIAFNLFETSISQKGKVFGKPEKGGADIWNLTLAKNRGHKLFLAALKAEDSFRQQLILDDDKVKEVHKELDELLKDMDDTDIRSLCDLAASNSGDGWKLCREEQLGSVVQSLQSQNFVLRKHLKARLKDSPHKKMSVFIYGHTHQMVPPQSLDINSLYSVTWLNSGAFQRLIDEEGFLKRVKEKGWKEQDGLRRLKPEDLAPCYGVVLVPYSKEGQPEPTTMMWWMPTSEKKGKLISPNDQRCK